MTKCGKCGTAWTSPGMILCPMCGARVEEPAKAPAPAAPQAVAPPPPPPKDPTPARVPVFRKEPAKPTLPAPPKAAAPPPPPPKDPTPVPVPPLQLDREAVIRKTREAVDAALSDYGFRPPRVAPAEDESWYRAGPLEVESPPPKRIESRAPASVPKPPTPARRRKAPLVLGVLTVLLGVILVAVLRLGVKLPWPH